MLHVHLGGREDLEVLKQKWGQGMGRGHAIEERRKDRRGEHVLFHEKLL